MSDRQSHPWGGRSSCQVGTGVGPKEGSGSLIKWPASFERLSFHMSKTDHAERKHLMFWYSLAVLLKSAYKYWSSRSLERLNHL